MYFWVLWGTVSWFEVFLGTSRSFYFLAVPVAKFSTNSELLAVLSCSPLSPSNVYFSVVFESQIPLSAEACLRLTLRHPFIHPFCFLNGDHRLSTYLTFTLYKFWDRRGLRQNVFETVFVFVYLHICALLLRKHVQLWIPKGPGEVV